MTTTTKFVQETELTADNCMRGAYPRNDEKSKRLDMPHFTLIAADNYAIRTIFTWLEHAKQTGLSEDKITETQNILLAMQHWRDNNPQLCKNPD